MAIEEKMRNNLDRSTEVCCPSLPVIGDVALLAAETPSSNPCSSGWPRPVRALLVSFITRLEPVLSSRYNFQSSRFFKEFIRIFSSFFLNWTLFAGSSWIGSGQSAIWPALCCVIVVPASILVDWTWLADWKRWWPVLRESTLRTHDKWVFHLRPNVPCRIRERNDFFLTSFSVNIPSNKPNCDMS